MVFLDVGTLRNAEVLRDPIKSLCAAIGLHGAIHLLDEFSDGFSETRVVLAEHRSGPDDPQPFRLVFKIGAADALRDEVRRYREFFADARATSAFVPVLKADLTFEALPPDETLAAIAYAYASDVFGAKDCVSFKSLFRRCIKGEYAVPAVAEMVESLARVLASLYSETPRRYAHEIARYYLEHWAPDYQVAADNLVDGENRLLLTLQRLNPDHFRRESPSASATLRREAESPSHSSCSDIALSTCVVAKVRREQVVVWVNSPDDLSLGIDTRDLPTASRAKITKGSTISLWTPRKVSRYDFYVRRAQPALPSLDVAAPSFRVGPLCVHNPLAHFSAPLLAATKPPALTWTVPAHGDLHPGNVLIAGTSPALIDYGKSATNIPVGVDAARFFGGLVRDVLAEVLSFEELAMVLADSLEIGSFVKETDSPASRAVYLLKLISERLVPPTAPDSRALWPVHLYGYAWIGLKWPNGSPESYRACFLLAGLALQRLLGAAPVAVEDPLAAPGGTVVGRPVPSVIKARPIKPEGPAEILILVSRFDGRADYDPTVRIYSALADLVFEIMPGLARVEQIEEVISSRKDAVELAGRHRASMIVWGTFDNLGIWPHYEVTRDSLVARRSMIQLDQATRHQLSERFEPYITQNLAAEMSFLSLVAVAAMCELNLNLDAAIKVYNRALTLVPDAERARALGAAEVYRSLAALHFALKRDKEAVAANDKAREFGPNDLSTALQRLQIQSRVEKKSEVQQIEEFKNLLRTHVEANTDDPATAILREVLARLEPLRTSADFRKLVESASRTMPVDSSNMTSGQYKKDVAVHLLRAQELLYADKFNRCSAEIRSALRLNPSCAEAFLLRASLLAFTDHVEDGLKDLERAERLNPKMPEIYLVRGKILFASEDFSLAVRQFEKAFELDISKRLVLPDWGSTMIELGRGGEAMHSMRDWDLDPSNPRIFIVRSHYYRKQRKYELALREVNQAIELAVPSSSDASARDISFTERAKVYEAMGWTNLAIQDLEQAIECSAQGTFGRRRLSERLAKLRSLSTTAEGGAQESSGGKGSE